MKYTCAMVSDGVPWKFVAGMIIVLVGVIKFVNVKARDSRTIPVESTHRRYF